MQSKKISLVVHIKVVYTCGRFFLFSGLTLSKQISKDVLARQGIPKPTFLFHNAGHLSLSLRPIHAALIDAT
jgi:hypothetical protein